MTEGCGNPAVGSLLTRYELGLLGEEDDSRLEQHLLECDSCFALLARDSEIIARFLQTLSETTGPKVAAVV